MKLTYRYSTGLAAISLVMSASADVIYSNLQDIIIPADYDGVYLDVNAASAEAYIVNPNDADTNWDINPFFGGKVVANSPAFQPVRVEDGGLSPLVNLSTPGTVIDAASLHFSSTNNGAEYGGSQTHLGNTITAGEVGTMGFKVNLNTNLETPPTWAYGWMRVVFTDNTGGAMVKDWAYDTSGSGLATGNVVQSAVASNAQTVTLNSAAGSFTLGSQITNSGAEGVNVNSVVKTGAGTTILTGANTYTGTTTVSAGALSINGSTGSGDVTVSNGGTKLMGTGTVGGNTTLTSGAIHAPGNSVGTQALSGNLTYSSSIFEWELATTPDTSGRGTNYDAVNVAGTLGGSDAIFRVVLNGSQDFSEGFWNSNHNWTDLFTAADGTTPKTDWANIFSSVQYYNGSLGNIGMPTSQGAFSMTGNTLTWTAVPEASSALAGLLLGAGLLRRKRSAVRTPWPPHQGTPQLRSPGQ
jgi:autotransporter-associated beta strand protein